MPIVDRGPGGQPGGEQERMRILALLGVDGSDAVESRLGRLCRVSVDELALWGAAVSVMTISASGGSHAGSIAGASGAPARTVEELEFSLGEGPGTDAFLTSRPVLAPDLESSLGRWPGYAPAARAAGLGAVFAFPLHVGASRFGVLTLHSAEARSLSDADVATSLLLTELATEMLLDGYSPSAGRGLEGSSPLGVDGGRAQIYQAQGMVMVQLGVELPEALARLRAHAFASGQELSQLAAEVVAGRVRLTRDTDGAL